MQGNKERKKKYSVWMGKRKKKERMDGWVGGREEIKKEKKESGQERKDGEKEKMDKSMNG